MDAKFEPIVKNRDTYYVLVSHRELDSLIGRLMQMCELTGDTEQRKALKDEIKQRSRQWLDDLYRDSGYDKWSGIMKDIEPYEINPSTLTYAKESNTVVVELNEDGTIPYSSDNNGKPLKIK